VINPLILLQIISWADILDIAVIATLFYFVLHLLKQTRSTSATRGVVGVIVFSFGLYAIARLMGLTATSTLFERFWLVLALAVLIIFQNEFRKGILDISRRSLVRRFSRNSMPIDEVVKAVKQLSRLKEGALICIERLDSLKIHMETGTAIDALISKELITCVFKNYSPLHDGAVIIRGDRLAAAACMLPLTETPMTDTELGMRHRAAIGLSQQADAVVIAVSEETGIISLAVDSQFERHHTPESLKEAIQELMNIEEED
jgi:diadenylate cyclase